MKDISARNIPKDTVYKDVVIIGNGPSGISLSYMLSGNWPYWNTDKIRRHPDEMLRARLNYADCNKSLIEQDLGILADGLEGRSTNPVSLLLDSLEHPCADIGMDLPSMVDYKQLPNKQIDHIVLGKGPPGGTWHKMDPNLRTLSLASWMSLPGFSYSKWEAQQLQKRLDDSDQSAALPQRIPTQCEKCLELRSRKALEDFSSQMDSNEEMLTNNNESEPEALCCKCTKALNQTTTNPTVECNENVIDVDVDDRHISDQMITDEINKLNTIISLPPRRNLSLKRQVSKEVQTRALVSRVAEYYADYVRQMKLDRNFVNDTNVTLIAPLNGNCSELSRFPKARWIVTGINEKTSRPFYYACQNVVLANGVSDLPNRLGLKGEHIHRDWVKHELPQLETALEKYSDVERRKLKPVLVVGAGLSAADAVTICRMSDVHVVHVYRSKTAGLDKMLPQNVYPEYHEVHNMMRAHSQKYDFYTPIPEHTITHMATEPNGVHRVTIQNLRTAETQTLEVSYCVILIGSRPDLRFTSGVTKCAIRNAIAVTNSYITPDQYWSPAPSPLSRKLSWLKGLCEKCKHLSLCDWNRRGAMAIEYKKICGHTAVVNRKNEELCTVEDSGLGLGLDPTRAIDSKTNQIDVDKYTNEVQRVPKGMFAMGPLVGDNFVRFIPGGALAITAALHTAKQL